MANSCDLEFANANAACMECSNVVVKEGTLKSLSAFTLHYYIVWVRIRTIQVNNAIYVPKFLFYRVKSQDFS